jgi:hypothetical protein
MRIELDQPPVRWKQYYLEPASSGPAAAKRYYFHKRTWINDDDHVVLEGLTIPQAQAAASIVALSGGTMMSGDRMSDLDAVRLDILRKVLPSYGEAARPVDLFERDRPEIFALQVKRPFGEWLVLGVFSADENAPVEKVIPLERLRLDPSKTFVAYDFWKQQFHGELREKLQLKLEPSSCIVLAIHEKRGTPQVIGSDRHVLQGAVELADVAWDPATSTLRGHSLGPSGTDHRLAVYLPEPHPWVQADPFFFYDREGYTLRMLGPNIMRIHVRFTKAERADWSVDFRQFWGK